MNGKNVVRPCIFGGLWAFFCGFIFYNSFQTGVQSSIVSDSLASKISALVINLGVNADMDTLVKIIRKGAHFGEFFIMGILLCLSFYYGASRYLKQSGTILFMLLSVGVVDEFIQSFIAGRSSQVSDVLIDFSGAFLAFCVIALFQFHNANKGGYKRAYGKKIHR